MLSEKNLGQKGKMSRNNKQKFQLNRVERPEGGAPFCDKRKAQQEEEGLLFPGKDSAKEKLRTLCFLQSSQLFFSSLWTHSLLAMSGLVSGSWWQTLRCNSLLTLNLNWSLLEKYLSVYLFQLNSINIIHEEKQMHHSETSSILLSGREKFPFLPLLNSCTRINNKTDTN